MKHTLIAALFFLMLVGCGKSGDTAPEASTTPSDTSSASTTPVAFRNESGELLCPVMNKTIKSEADADGFQDYEGTRYYFCCGMCPGKFKENPAQYAKK